MYQVTGGQLHACVHLALSQSSRDVVTLRCQVGEILVACAIAVAWSPAGAYLQTFERPNKELGNAYKNLKVQL